MFPHYLRALVVLFLLVGSSAYADWQPYSTCVSSANMTSLMLNCENLYSYCGVEDCSLPDKQRVMFSVENPCSGQQEPIPGTTECAGNPCDEGWTYTGGVCLPNEQPDTCENVVGYINGEPVCNDLRDECEASGGSLGQVNGQSVCVPHSEGPPTCDGDGVIIITESGYVCESPSDNENGTNDLDEGSSGGADPDTDVDMENPETEAANDPDPDTITDATELNQEALRESQEANKSLRKMQNQLGDVNDELDAQSGYLHRAEERELDRDSSRAMPEHTVNGSQSLAEALDSFMTGLSSTPLVQSFSAVADVIPSSGGSCPVLSIDLSATPIGEVVSTDIHCSLFLDIAAELSLICLVMYSILGFRIVVSS